MRFTGLFSVAAVAVLVISSSTCHALTTTSQTSLDGTQRGSIQFSQDGRSGTVSSSSQGRGTAFAGSSLVIGPATAQGSFVTQGDSQSVADTLTVGGDDDDENVAPAIAPSTPGDAREENAAAATPEEETGNKDITVLDQSIPDEPSIEEMESMIAEATVASTQATGTETFKRVCVVNDDDEFKRQLNMGHETTLVKATKDGLIEILTALKLPNASTKSIIVTRFIPESIRDRCNVTYEALGLNDRAGDGFSTISGESSSFQFSSLSGSQSTGGSVQEVRAKVFGNLCKQDFFRIFALYEECKKYAPNAQLG